MLGGQEGNTSSVADIKSEVAVEHFGSPASDTQEERRSNRTGCLPLHGLHLAADRSGAEIDLKTQRKPYRALPKQKSLRVEQAYSRRNGDSEGMHPIV